MLGHQRRSVLGVFLPVFFCLAATGAFGLSFNFTPASGMSEDAINGFNAAGARWSAFFGDNVTVNINIDFKALGTGVLGQASATKNLYADTLFYNAMVNDRKSPNDYTAVSNLQAAPNFDMLINRTKNSPYGEGSATPYLDNDGDANNSFVWLATANAKALGLLAANNPASDATITLSSSFNWDFNPDDGIGAGKIDFVGVATHEIGHALGFISGVDVLDANSSGTYYNDNVFTNLTALDLFRYSTESAAQDVIDWTADTRNKYFSIDGGDTSLGRFATGVTWGDGRQASHWKDNLGLGIMDPTTAYGERKYISDLDVMAFDVIGWDMIIPEPATAALFFAGLLGVVGAAVRRVRRRR